MSVFQIYTRHSRALCISRPHTLLDFPDDTRSILSAICHAQPGWPSLRVCNSTQTMYSAHESNSLTSFRTGKVYRDRGSLSSWWCAHDSHVQFAWPSSFRPSLPCHVIPKGASCPADRYDSRAGRGASRFMFLDAMKSLISAFIDRSLCRGWLALVAHPWAFTKWPLPPL